MTAVFYAPRAVADIERLTDFLLATDQKAAAETGEILFNAIAHLARPNWLRRALSF